MWRFSKSVQLYTRIKLASMKYSVSLILVILWALICTVSGEDDESPIITLPGLGKIRGKTIFTAWTQREVKTFIDIKYAESTAGPNRFKPAIPVRPWRGIRNATEPGNSCPSVLHLEEFEGFEDESLDIEDCLTLTISTHTVMGKQPVMVFIHGEHLYEGNNLEGGSEYLLEKDVVLVAPQYRLGPFGFLSTLSEQIPGNAGVFDIIQALEWIHKYISYFGGDPERVTLLGQVGSAALVHILTFSPAVPKNLFHQVIYHSGSAVMPIFFTDKPIKFAKQVANRAGCGTKLKLEDLNECLIDLSPFELLEAFRDSPWNPNTQAGGAQFSIGDPHNILPADPIDILRENINYSYPTMGGVPKNAGTRVLKEIFDTNFGGIAPDDIFKGKDYVDYIITQTIGPRSSKDLPKLVTSEIFSPGLLKNGSFDEMVPGLIDLAGSLLYKSSVFYALQRNAQFLSNKTFLYSFDYRGEYNRYIETDEDYYKNTPFLPGVSLTDENIYLFPYPGQADLLNTLDTIMAVNMIELWTSFAATGAPSMNGITWPPMTGNNGPYLKIDLESQVGVNYFDEFAATVTDEMSGHSILSKFFDHNSNELKKLNTL